MPDPVILVVAEAQAPPGMEADLSRRYGARYRLLTATSVEAGLEALRRLKDGLDQLALCIVALPTPALTDAALLDEMKRLYPDARQAVLSTSSDSDAAMAVLTPAHPDDAAGAGARQGSANHYFTTPWHAPEQHIFPVLDELLDDWWDAVRLPRLLVEDVMSRQVTRIRHDSNAFHAAEIFALTGVADLMVVDDRSNFVGVISVGDILRAALPNLDEIDGQAGTMDDAFQLFLRKGRELSTVPILPLVIRDPLIAHPRDHVTKVVTVLIDRFIGRLPVVQDGRLVGTISRADICWAVVGAL